MAAVGAEVTASWFLSSGVVSFFIILLLLSIFLTAVCTDCGRRSFELQDSNVDKNPSALIRVVKLEEVMVARENPMINEIQNDEKENNCGAEKTVHFTPWRSHLGAPQNNQGLTSAGQIRYEQPQCVYVDTPTPPASNHIYHTIREDGASDGYADTSSVATNSEPPSAAAAVGSSDCDKTSVYAQVSKKLAQPTSTVNTPEQVQEEEEGEEEESSPPLPDRVAEMEG
ncbi:hypothetical protein EXN66_Car001838 [Channa argus]|uniref:Uncharacterized protein n=1 Tax=Channa argus TaxID=215402 RepID=A0A6G1P7Z8_CHAAH|nr:hypothetical protein EXN66_Car001838 [Channa argus]